jgi:hypothetical protein
MQAIVTLLILLVCVPASVAADAFTVSDLRCEDLVDPLGIDTAKPRLSWRMEAAYNGAVQKSYPVLCATSPELLREGAADLWDSGKVETDQSQHVVNGGKALQRGVPCFWTVQIWNERGDASDWSPPTIWTTFDMTSSSARKAQWITQNHKGAAVPWMRRSVDLDCPRQRAYIYVNAMGYFQLSINGTRVSSAHREHSTRSWRSSKQGQLPSQRLFQVADCFASAVSHFSCVGGPRRFIA